VDPEPTRLTGETALVPADLVHAILVLRLFRYRWLYLACAGLLVVIYIVMSGPGGATLESFAPFLVFTVVFAAFLFAGPHVFARRAISAMPDPTVHWEIGEDALTIATRGTSVTWSWEQITAFHEKASVFLLWVRPGSVQAIPKRAFAPDGVAWLRAKLERAIVPRRKGRGRRVRWVLLWLALVILFLVVWQLLSGGT
jgi:hypothetical protein